MVGRRLWTSPLTFAVHVVVGSVMWGIMAVPAVGLNLCVKKLDSYGIDMVIIDGVRAAEYCLFATDFLLLLIFLYKTVKRGTGEL